MYVFANVHSSRVKLHLSTDTFNSIVSQFIRLLDPANYHHTITEYTNFAISLFDYFLTLCLTELIPVNLLLQNQLDFCNFSIWLIANFMFCRI